MEKLHVTILNWDKFHPNRKDVTNPTWFKVSNDFPTSESLFGLSATERYVFFALLCLAGKRCDAEIEIDLVWFCHWAGGCFSPEEVIETANKLDGRNVRVTSTLRARNADVTQIRLDKKRIDKNGDFDFELPYGQFPKRPKGEDNRKAPGIKKARKLIRTPEQYERFVRAVKNYAASCDGKDPQYRTKWANWVENWEEWVDKPSSAGKTAAPLTDPILKYMPQGNVSA